MLEAYKKHKGKMGAIVDSIMLGTEADEDRFRTMIEAAIESKKASSFPAFRKAAKTSAGSKKSSAKRKAKADKVTAQAFSLPRKVSASVLKVQTRLCALATAPLRHWFLCFESLRAGKVWLFLVHQ